MHRMPNRLVKPIIQNQDKTMIKPLSFIAASALLLLAGNNALAGTCDLVVSSDDKMTFDTTELKVPGSCKEVKLTLKHTGTLPVTAMGHNWVLSETSKVRSIANAGMSAGPETSYLKADDERVLAHTKLIGGGESTTITFKTDKLTAGTDYTFFCSFPGHSGVMKGKFVFS